ncbi:predicted protein [Plenodomus lingam JN3]|uniref:Predicted protein n=1 Tax=Leptosphaeria maculans (strain JN3 / isolate v23.1.3 / race Av1-4-5-6-7-8) TaxID=985895 RepID=E5A1M0_LEPMJ|nr:predicted protein [Plenodomus lingam JN3]CBX97484.1 predicted protein [Plenodomus lingam JN3]
MTGLTLDSWDYNSPTAAALGTVYFFPAFFSLAVISRFASLGLFHLLGFGLGRGRRRVWERERERKGREWIVGIAAQVGV